MTRIEGALRDLVRALFLPVPAYPGAEVFHQRIVYTLAHAARELLDLPTRSPMHTDPRGFISVDDHIIEPPNLFIEWGPKHMADDLPQWQMHEGHVGWAFAGTHYGISKAATAAGQPWGKAGIFVPSESVPEGLSDPVARLRAMDEDGIAVSLCFPSMMGLGGETMTRAFKSGGTTKTVAEEALRAYNRFLFEGWCSAAPNRFIPVVALPLWDPKEAAWWANDMAARGAKGILFPQAPDQIGLPPVWHSAWAPLFRTCEEAGLAVVQHIFSDDTARYFGTDLPPYLPLTLARTSAIETIAAWITTPALDNHPRLKIMVAESGVSWIPWFLALANESARLHRFEFGPLKMLPMQRFEQHFGLSVLGNEVLAPGTVEALPAGTQARLMFESDLPHIDGSYPHSRAAFAGLGIPEWMRPGVARDNAVEFFALNNPFQFPEAPC